MKNIKNGQKWDSVMIVKSWPEKGGQIDTLSFILLPTAEDNLVP